MHSTVAKEDMDKKAFINAASSYIELLRNHITKENTIFFPFWALPLNRALIPSQHSTDYFMETAVRLHRAAEGMPFTGLKPASPNPTDIEKAEKALVTGNIDPLQTLLKEELDNETSKWFKKALEAKKNKGKSLEAGRRWVDSYVKYIVILTNST